MKTTRVKITERDKEILQFINEFGFCELDQISECFQLNTPRNYQIMNRLQGCGLVKQDRVFYRRPGVFRLSKKGAAFTELPPLNQIPLATYEHDIMLIRLAEKLKQLNPKAQWISERRLRHKKFFDGVGKRGHIPDGLLIFPDGKEVAIELELSMKGKKRLQNILEDYVIQRSIREVWYYCLPSLLESLRLGVAKAHFVKVYNISDVLKG